jgi:hypothetical protein
MLKIIREISKQEWESNKRSVRTRGGVYIASVSSEKIAKVVAIIPRLLEMCEKDLELAAKIEKLFEEAA